VSNVILSLKRRRDLASLSLSLFLCVPSVVFSHPYLDTLDEARFFATTEERLVVLEERFFDESRFFDAFEERFFDAVEESHKLACVFVMPFLAAFASVVFW
jgi:hypothetical protein